MGRAPVTSLDDLHADPANRRTHSDRNVAMVREALEQVGTARSIVIDEGGTILAGNTVTAAARAAGITHVRVIDTAGDEVIAVRRTGLTPEQKRALALYDNRTAELAEWDVAQLTSDRDLGLDLRAFFTEAEEALVLGTATDPTWDGMPAFEQPHAGAWRAITVHVASEADWLAFCAAIGRPDLLDSPKKYCWYPKDDRAVFRTQGYAATEDPEAR